jgi:hypothetical protein
MWKIWQMDMEKQEDRGKQLVAHFLELFSTWLSLLIIWEIEIKWEND